MPVLNVYRATNGTCEIRVSQAEMDGWAGSLPASTTMREHFYNKKYKLKSESGTLIVSTEIMYESGKDGIDTLVRTLFPGKTGITTSFKGVIASVTDKSATTTPARHNLLAGSFLDEIANREANPLTGLNKAPTRANGSKPVVSSAAQQPKPIVQKNSTIAGKPPTVKGDNSLAEKLAQRRAKVDAAERGETIVPVVNPPFVVAKETSTKPPVMPSSTIKPPPPLTNTHASTAIDPSKSSITVNIEELLDEVGQPKKRHKITLSAKAGTSSEWVKLVANKIKEKLGENGYESLTQAREGVYVVISKVKDIHTVRDAVQRGMQDAPKPVAAAQTSTAFSPLYDKATTLPPPPPPPPIRTIGLAAGVIEFTLSSDVDEAKLKDRVTRAINTFQNQDGYTVTAEVKADKLTITITRAGGQEVDASFKSKVESTAQNSIKMSKRLR